LDKLQAQRKFSGVEEIITDLNQKLAAELSLAEGGYIKPAEVLQALTQHAGPAPEVLERAFHEYFSFGSDVPFDPTLFHYLLVRLGKVGSRAAVTYCLDVLTTRPEETGQIFVYFAAVRLERDDQTIVAEYLGSDEAIYDYQSYQILRWFHKEQVSNGELLQLCRRWIADRNRDPWLRSYAFAYLRTFGSAPDWAQIEESYGEAMTELERADRVAAVERLERGRRNTFYARVAGHGKLVSRAVVVAKTRTSAS
jgi:hypothetical protein